MTVKEYLERTFEGRGEYELRNTIVCNDGFSVSVQGGTIFHYCTPREHVNIYDEVELGFPSEAQEELMQYIDGDFSPPTDNVYAYVPIDLVESIIKKHGGINENKTCGGKKI
jgi:hypothetical protein